MEASGTLIDAARRGDADAVAGILDAGPALVNAKANGVSALLLALSSPTAVRFRSGPAPV
jgi:hypothetical protein